MRNLWEGGGDGRGVMLLEGRQKGGRGEEEEDEEIGGARERKREREREREREAAEKKRSGEVNHS